MRHPLAVLVASMPKEGKKLRRKAGGSAHAKQFKRLLRTVKRRRTTLGALMRNAQRALLCNIGVKPTTAVVDPQFRSVDDGCPPLQIIQRGKFKSLDAQQRRWLKRRPAIEPAIGHTKSDDRMDCCLPSGSCGGVMHAELGGAGHNNRWLLRRVITANGLASILWVFSQLARRCMRHAACISNMLRVPAPATEPAKRRLVWQPPAASH